jgi:hypothetical protein
MNSYFHYFTSLFTNLQAMHSHMTHGTQIPMGTPPPAPVPFGPVPPMRRASGTPGYSFDKLLNHLSLLFLAIEISNFYLLLKHARISCIESTLWWWWI